MHTYDGFYFLPAEDDDDDLVLSYFDFVGEYADAEPVESTEIGNKYHIAFFRKNEDGLPEFDESFEAILGDPATYVQNLVGAGLYGCIVKKTTKSGKWFEDYLTKVESNVTMDKLEKATRSFLKRK